MKKTILILGASGMAGHIVTLFLRRLTEKYNVIAVARSNSMIEPNLLFDVTDFGKLQAVITNENPRVIINCVGVLNSDAEERPDQGILINSYLPHFLEEATRDLDCKVIHISTDCVFSGSKGSYSEGDLKDGKGFYAQSKALGEIINKKDLTIRTSIVGPDLSQKGIGLFNWFARQKGVINGYSNAYWSGVTTIELAKSILFFLENDITGLYHLTGSQKISKFYLLSMFKELFSLSRVTAVNVSGDYHVDKSLINTRTDVSFEVSSYPDMLSEMNEWIISHPELYPHYSTAN